MMTLATFVISLFAAYYIDQMCEAESERRRKRRK